jgi:hypothetical protein
MQTFGYAEQGDEDMPVIGDDEASQTWLQEQQSSFIYTKYTNVSAEKMGCYERMN